MTDPHAAIAAEIARLRSDYQARLPAELAELGALAAGLTGSEADRPALESLHHRLHKLAGSGGTFGLAALSDRARHLEHTVERWLESPLVTIDEGSRRSFADDMAALAATLNGAEARPAAPAGATGVAATPPRFLVWLALADTSECAGLEQALAQFGYQLRCFPTLADVLAAAGDPPDALICDARFAAEGIDATQRLAAADAPACPILFIGNDDDFAQRARAARIGARAFLLRPLDASVLAENLERVFETHRDAPYRVLIIDDDTDLANHYRLVLSLAGIEAEVLTAPADIIERIAAFRPEMLLLDLNMPDYSGPELAAVIRQYEAWIGLPIVFLSAETDLDKQIAALGQGADDFLVKPISDTHLAAAVRVRAARFRQLADLVTRDSLTGLLRHARIKEEIDAVLSRARRSGAPVSVSMLDIDHFKSVNDTYGHATGDRVIKAVSQLLRQRLRKSDSIGRYGGEEFAVVLPDCDASTAHGIIDDIRRRFGGLHFRQGEVDFSCSLSAGVACSIDHPQASCNELLIAADEALYAAKHGGRNQVRIAAGEKGI